MGDALEAASERGDEAGVLIGDHQPHTTEAVELTLARTEDAQNDAPESRADPSLRPHRSMLLCVVKGRSGRGCGQTSDGPLGVEGGLLLGRAVSPMRG